MSRERAALIRSVRANPACRATRLVFADWLQDRDDPLAEYVRAECEVMAAESNSPPWQAGMKRLLDLTTAAGGPLGGWEYRAEVKRMNALLADAREDAEDDDGDGERLAECAAIPEPDLLRFELRHGITLPADYRAFLLRVANGWPCSDVANDLISLDVTRDYRQLAEPFPATDADAATAIKALAQRAAGDEYPDVLYCEFPESSGGCLPAANFGCANGAHVVVRGELRGQVWSYVEVCGPFLDEGFTRPVNYFEWFEMMKPV